MKKIISISLIIILAAYFFLFTNTGSGIIELINNTIKGDPQIPLLNEIVMPPKSMIEATTPTGKITIKSGKGLKRYYTWDGVTRSVVMWPRTERWFGSLGAYYPGPGFHWIGHNGIKRGVVGEGQQHFDTIDEAQAWLHSNSHSDCAYRDDGLAVCFSKNLDRHQLNVHVWQIYIEGKTPSTFQERGGDRIWVNSKNNIYKVGGHKPTKLEGSNNESIRASWDTK
ncbi:MAG: hypothetical protein PHF56_11535 [Desulfuromonadaceae bacterium]|nr:hypothetical protein [Desulfuromonadaceae bacterium]